MSKSDDWIQQLGLSKHPEGGFYKEVYRSPLSIPKTILPEGFSGDRAVSTAIYYLLQKGEYSSFHRIKSDESWHFYDGAPLELLMISPEGELSRKAIGIEPLSGLHPQFTVPAAYWFAAHSLGSFSLVGCTVAPGFDFADFELGERSKLIASFPQQQEVIEQFTDDP